MRVIMLIPVVEMMMISRVMRRFLLYIFHFLLLVAVPLIQLSGQQRDFQFWPSVQVNLEVVNNLKIHVEEELRLRENVSQISRQVNDIGISYRVNSHLKAGIFYRLEADWKNADTYTWRNGLYSDIALKYNVNRISLGYRLRLQSSKVERNDEDAVLFDGFRHRHKISAEYDIKGLPLIPFIESELFVDYSTGKKSEISGIRSWIGLDYTVNKIHTFTLKYGIDQEMNISDPMRAYIVALGYSLDLKL